MADIAEMDARLNRLVRDGIERTARGGDNGGMDGLEPRVAKLEASVGHIERDIGDIKTDLRDLRRDVREDFRIVWGGLIALGVALAGLMAKGFHWL